MRGGVSDLSPDFPELDDCSASTDRLHVGSPHPVHRTNAAVRNTHGYVLKKGFWTGILFFSIPFVPFLQLAMLLAMLFVGKIKKNVVF